MGIKDDLLEIEELSLKMIVALGENDVKSLEDFAYCSSDDLLGWDETVGEEKIHENGILENFDITYSQANDLIMSSRIKLGIIPDDSEVEETDEEFEVEEDSAKKSE